MSINIGNNNKIKNTNIIEGNTTNNKRTWMQRHPFILSIIISLSTGFIMLFSFWQEAASFIESIFR